MKRFISAEKTLLLTIIFLAATILISAKIVSAQVTDKRQRALADVSVTDGFKRVFTNSKGMFNLNTEADSLLISKLGYEQKIISTYKLPATITLIAKPIILEPIKVTTRYVTPFSNALDKTVISSDAERTGITFSETMFRESALNSADVRLAGEKQTLSLLGNLPRHTLVMLDNVPLNPHGEPFDISSLPLGKVTRIEIVKGNASVYGGTSAIGGIVYLYTGDTKTGQPLKLSQDTALGSFRQVRQSYAFEQQMPHLSYEAAYSWQDARNDFPY
ncbi:MAG: TonB-dependent receptor plug domain-containing protein, partial [Candidatus Cloacimonetes bacterium]|nr:TonB-dependent receptor plug domain-containing protein [Candidatus Cloacimonadota bacterium]